MDECNPQKLFAWPLSDKLVEPILVPYNNSLSSDPFRQLINKAVPTAEKKTWNQISVINKSPGRLTIHMACAIKRYLREEKIYLSQKSACANRIHCLKEPICLGGMKKNIMQLQRRDIP